MAKRNCEIDLQYFDVYLTETGADPGVHCEFKNEMAGACQKKKKLTEAGGCPPRVSVRYI